MLLEPRLQNLVPADDSPAVCRKVAADSLREVRLQRVGVADAKLPGARLHGRRGIPLILDGLVAADVNAAAGKKLDDLCQDVLQKLAGLRFQIEEMSVHTPAGGDA